MWYRECKGEKICTDVKTVTSSQDLKHRPGKAQWEALHNADTVDCTAVLKAYLKVPHLRLVNALCMECAHWGMCALGYFLLLSAHLSSCNFCCVGFQQVNTSTPCSSPSSFSSMSLWPPAHQMSSMLVPSQQLMCGALVVQC